MKQALIIALTALVSLFTMPTTAQEAKRLINLDPSTFRPVQTDALTGVGIDKIGLDRSKRPCARIKIHLNRMSREDIEKIVVRTIGGSVELTRQHTAYEGNGLIIELTAKEHTRFYLQHEKYGDSNEVALNLEGNKEYRLDGQLNLLLSIAVATNVVGADVYLDKVYKGVTDENGLLTIESVAMGKHVVMLQHGETLDKQEINVSSDKISFRLTINPSNSATTTTTTTTAAANNGAMLSNQLITPEVKTYKVGDYYDDGEKQGVVFWVDASGEHGKIVSLTESSKIPWTSDKTEEKTIIDTNSEGDGAYNTNIVKQIYDWQSKYPAFKWCADLGEGWYLPAIEELKLFTLDNTVRNAINQTLATKGGTKIPDIGTVHWYWSSTESTVKYKGMFCVWLVTMSLGDTYDYYKYLNYSVRAVSAFGNKSQAEAITTATYADSATANFGGFEMVFVKGGTFTMGATAEQGSDAGDGEKPVHSVTVSNFYIGKYEVTQAQWEAVMGKNPSRYKGDNRPVENVSWNDVQKFIKKLNAKTGKKYRLPTEAEWEYAARGGNQSKGYKYSGSNNRDEVAWYTNNSGKQTHPVGQKQPNELGLYDMSGNVWEWCSDWYGSYSSGSQTNPTGPANGSYRVLRGGGWFNSARGCRVSSRGGLTPSLCSSDYGFRLVCQP